MAIVETMLSQYNIIDDTVNALSQIFYTSLYKK
jgi:hypothetical protein